MTDETLDEVKHIQRLLEKYCKQETRQIIPQLQKKNYQNHRLEVLVDAVKLCSHPECLRVLLIRILKTSIDNKAEEQRIHKDAKRRLQEVIGTNSRQAVYGNRRFRNAMFFLPVVASSLLVVIFLVLWGYITMLMPKLRSVETVIPTTANTAIPLPSTDVTHPTDTPIVPIAIPTTQPTVSPSPTALEAIASATMLPTSITAQVRFTTFPIQVYMTAEHPRWEAVLQHVFTELQPYFEMQRIETIAQAHIVIEIMTTNDAYLQSPCYSQEQYRVACTQVTTIRNYDGSNYVYNLSSHIWLSPEIANAEGTLLHEFLHALGVQDHSASPQDIMYAYESTNTHLSINDIAVLRRLYPERFP